MLYSFQAIKNVDNLKEERIRIVSISKEHLIEKSGDDEVTALYRFAVFSYQSIRILYQIHFDFCCFSLKDIAGIVVKDGGSKEVIIEFKSWRPAQYFIQARDDFLASMADVMESLSLSSFNIHLEPFLPHMFPERPHPFYQVVDSRTGF